MTNEKTTMGPIDKPMSTEELRKRIQKRKEYRERMKSNPPEEPLSMCRPKNPPKTKAEKNWKKVEEAVDQVFKKLDAITPKIVNFTSKLLLAAILWIVLGHFVPEIRDILPAFYQLVDGILWCFNGVLEWSLNGLKDLGHFFGIG